MVEEAKWSEYIRFNCFSYALWQMIWDSIGPTMWESILPHWRLHIENIILHYIQVQPECIEDMETTDGHGQQAVAVDPEGEDVW